MKQIREWLASKGQDYAQGLALYEAHGKSRVVLTALRRGESEFTRQKLREELSRLVQGAPPVPAGSPPARRVAETPSRTSAAPLVNQVAPPADVPDQVRQQRSSWYAERHRLHAQLELLPTDEQRRVAAERIVELSALLTASYQDASAPGEAPAPRPDLAGLTDQGEIRRRLANLRPHASKLKKNPARALDLQQVQADIKLLENKLVKP